MGAWRRSGIGASSVRRSKRRVKIEVAVLKGIVGRQCPGIEGFHCLDA